MSKAISVGGWKGKDVAITFASPHEAVIVREAVSAYLRLYAGAGDDAKQVCEQFIAQIDEQWRAAGEPEPPKPSLSPENLDAPVDGEPKAQFQVKADGVTTPWSVTTAQASWIKLPDPPGPLVGDGTVNFEVKKNTGAAREGQIQVTGLNLSFAVKQAAATELTVQPLPEQEPEQQPTHEGEQPQGTEQTQEGEPAHHHNKKQRYRP